MTVIIDAVLLNRMVGKYQLFGAGLVYGLAMGSILVIYTVVITANFVRMREGEDETIVRDQCME